MLHDRTVAPDEALPDTGIGLLGERLLSPLFVESPIYGTCSSTALVVTQAGQVAFSERTTNPEAPTFGAEVAAQFVVPRTPAG